MLNWSKIEARELVRSYYDYSPEYRKVKMKDQESDRITKIQKAIPDEALLHLEPHKKNEVQLLEKDKKDSIKRIAQLQEKYEKDRIEEFKSMMELEIRSLELQRNIINKENKSSGDQAEQSNQILRSALLNIFITLKIERAIIYNGYTYTWLWDLLQKDGFFERLRQKGNIL